MMSKWPVCLIAVVIIFLEACGSSRPRINYASMVRDMDISKIGCGELDKHMKMSFIAAKAFDVLERTSGKNEGERRKNHRNRSFWVLQHNEQLIEYKKRCPGEPKALKASGKKNLFKPLALTYYNARS